MKPTEKDPEIEKVLTRISGMSRQEAMDNCICPTCRKPLTGFRNRISEKEFRISGMCQKCQDSVFGED